MFFFFFKQKTAYEMRSRDWSSDVCSSDLPRELAAAGASLSGLEFLSRIGRGELPVPPAVEALGITPVEAGEGWIEFQLVPAEWHYNGLGTVHGGILSTLADSALG